METPTLRQRYRAWIAQWPEMGRWMPVLLPVTAACLALLAVGIYRLASSAPPEASAPAAAGWTSFVRAAPRSFPSEPRLWREAGLLLMTADPTAGRRLADLAAEASPDLAVAPAELEPGPEGTFAACAERAFGLSGAGARGPVERVLSPSSGDAAAGSELAALCARSAASASGYLGWLLLNGRSGEGLSWCAALPPAVAADPSVREFQAIFLCRSGDGAAFRRSLAAGAWGPAPADALDLALCARGMGQHGRDDLGRDLWGAAIAATGGDPSAGRILLRLALHAGLRAQAQQSFQALLAGGHGREVEIAYALWRGAPAP